MCRIYGYFGNKKLATDTLHKVAQRQFNGGPDAQHFQAGTNWAIGNNRLAIQDIGGGAQPYYSNNIHAVYNGEIYNHIELRHFLEKQGYTFKDNCDGSVIIPLYEIYGENFVKYLNGMFAIAIIDKRSETKLVLTCDPCSVKSAYYYFDEKFDTLFFSSELGSLLEFPVPKQLRLAAVNEYLIGRSIWHGNTFFDNIYELNPSTLLVKYPGARPRIATYESAIFQNHNQPVEFEATAAYFSDMIDKEMQQIVKADVPVCVVTSGGLDSSYITALATKHLSNLQCFNVSYEGDWPADEKVFAREVANYYGVKYNQVLIQENEFPDIINKTIQHLGQPNSAPHALSTYALFKAVNSAGFKVAITGEGADEFFGGYERFRKATFNQEKLWLNQYLDTMCATTHEKRQQAYSDQYKDFLLSNNSCILENTKNKITAQEKSYNSRLKSLLTFDQAARFSSYILRRVDHLSMANSVEVRVPFCQPNIVAFSRTLADDFLLDEKLVKKIIYRAARNKLPDSILNRPKQPFTLPIAAMLKKGHVLFEILCATLNSAAFLSRGIFNKKQIDFFIKQQLTAPNGNIADLLWSIMILELWLQRINLNLSL